MSFWDDDNYDGQGQSREEEVDGSLRAVACLMVMLMMVFLLVAAAIITMMVL